MNTLGHSQKLQADDTLTAWEDSSFIEQARRHNLSMGAKASGSFTLTSREDALENTLGTNRPMLLNLAGNPAVESCEGGLMRLGARLPLTATLRRAESLTQGQLRRTGQAPGCAAKSVSSMDRTTDRVDRVTGQQSGKPPFNSAAQGISHGVGRETGTSPVVNVCRDHKKTPCRASFCGTSAKGSVTRYERFGASPKAVRSEDRMADLMEAIC